MGDQPDFYGLLCEKLKRRWRSVDFYSISSCFGFYSKGMRTFSQVLAAMRTALTNPDPFRTESMRLLLFSDEHGIDQFGVERFHAYLEPAGLQIRRLAKPRETEDWVQFVLFDDQELIYTRPQGGFPDDALQLGINKLAPVLEAGREADEAVLTKYRVLFDRAWAASLRFDLPRIPTLNELADKLTEIFPIRRTSGMSEDDYEDQLFDLLHGLCHRKYIHRQFQFGDNRLDLVLGDPKTRLLAIELKLASQSESDLKRLKGQVVSYRELARDVLVVLVGPDLSPQKLAALESPFLDDPHVRILHLK